MQRRKSTRPARWRRREPCGAKFDGDPRYWKIVDGKLYLNLDAGIADAFNKDVAGAIKKAEANWPGLKTKA